LTYVLKEEDTNIIMGIPQIYNDNRNIKPQEKNIRISPNLTFDAISPPID